jgi:hypothetical protein
MLFTSSCFCKARSNSITFRSLYKFRCHIFMQCNKIMLFQAAFTNMFNRNSLLQYTYVTFELLLNTLFNRKNCSTHLFNYTQSISFFVEYNPPLSSVLWDVLLCSQTDVDWHFRGACCLHHHCPDWLHGSTSQKTLNFILAAMRTWSLTIIPHVWYNEQCPIYTIHKQTTACILFLYTKQMKVAGLSKITPQSLYLVCNSMQYCQAFLSQVFSLTMVRILSSAPGRHSKDLRSFQRDLNNLLGVSRGCKVENWKVSLQWQPTELVTKIRNREL